MVWFRSVHVAGWIRYLGGLHRRNYGIRRVQLCGIHGDVATDRYWKSYGRLHLLGISALVRTKVKEVFDDNSSDNSEPSTNSSASVDIATPNDRLADQRIAFSMPPKSWYYDEETSLQPHSYRS